MSILVGVKADPYWVKRADDYLCFGYDDRARGHFIESTTTRKEDMSSVRHTRFVLRRGACLILLPWLVVPN